MKSIDKVTKNSSTVMKEFEIESAEGKEIDYLEIYFSGYDADYYSSSMYLKYVYVE